MTKLLRFAGVALLALTIGVFGCDDDDPVAPPVPIVPPAPAPIVGTVSGTVSVEGSGLAGVTVNLSGAASQSAATGSSGGYSFADVPAGTHSVQISGAPAEVDFASTATAVTIATSGQTATADFSGTYFRTSTIEGSVTAGGEGVVATVTATGSGMLTDEEPKIGSSDTDGNFELTGLRAGTYHVAISEFGDIEFPVTMRNVTVGVGLSANVSFNVLGEDGPTTGTDVLVYISGVTDDDGDANKTSGRVTATIFIERERGDPLPEKIALYVDGAEVATRGFGATRAAEEPALAPAQQAGVEFSLSFDSDEYDPETGAVKYENGTHVILMGVTFRGSEAENESSPENVELENDDGYVVTADLGDNSVIGDDGRRWYGGPDNGTIDITALLVSYTGGSVTSVSANFCGEDPTGSARSDGYGYMFEFECKGYESKTDGDGDIPTISSPGEDGVILNDDHPFPAFVDFLGPTNSPIIVANRNGRENGWLNAAVALTGEVDADEVDDENWLVEGADDTGGVGGYNVMLRIGEDLEAALDASPGSALPAESEDSKSYCAVASATDDLGNMSEDPDDDACRPAPAGADVLMTVGMEEVYGAEADDLSGQTLKFGVDTTDPTIELDSGPAEGGRYNNATSIPSGANEGTRFIVDDDESDVGNSGLSDAEGATPVMVTVRRRGTDNEVVCPLITAIGEVDNMNNDADCGGMLLGQGTRLMFADPAIGGYMLDASVKDKAGNSASADPIAFVFDNEVARTTAAAVQGEITAGERFQMEASLNDNLSIRDYYVTVKFGDTDLGVGLPVPVDAIDANPRMNRNHTVTVPAIGFGTPTPIMAPYAGTQSALDATIVRISGVTVGVRDQTQAEYTGSMGGTFPTVEAPAGEKGFAGGDFMFELSVDDVCVEGDDDMTDGCMVMGEPTTSDLEFVATRLEGTFRDPFERVDFWMQDVNGQHWLLGSDDSGASGRTSGNDRTWTYSLNNVSGAMLYMMTRAAGFPGVVEDDMYTVRAFAVNGDNVALMASHAVMIDPD